MKISFRRTSPGLPDPKNESPTFHHSEEPAEPRVRLDRRFFLGRAAEAGLPSRASPASTLLLRRIGPMPSDSVLPRVVILGAGFAGLTAARTLSGTDVRVTVVDRRNHHLFSPLLYQVATAALSPGDIACPIRAILSRQANARGLLGDAVASGPGRRELVLTDER